MMKDPKEKEEVEKIYNERGFKKLSLEQYSVLKKEEQKRLKRIRKKAPLSIKLLAFISYSLAFMFIGFFIIVVIMQFVAVAPEKSKKEKKSKTSYEQNKKKTR